MNMLHLLDTTSPLAEKVAQPFLGCALGAYFVIPNTAGDLLSTCFIRARLRSWRESRPICGSRLQPRHKCLAINWALTPEGLPFDFFRNLFSRVVEQETQRGFSL
jgi:hypothetical protein